MENRGYQQVCNWSGVLGFLLFFIGMGPLCHWIPPADPSLSAQQIQQMYIDHLGSIRIGQVFVGFGVALQAVWSGQLVTFMKRIEGATTPLSNAMLVSAGLSFTVFLAGAMFFTAAAFHPERAPEITAALHDLGWLFWMMPAMPFMAMAFLLSMAVFSVGSRSLILPRWLGWYSAWCGLLQAGSILVGLFKTGPFAWNGFLAFYTTFYAYGTWVISALIAMAIELRRRQLR